MTRVPPRYAILSPTSDRMLKARLKYLVDTMFAVSLGYAPIYASGAFNARPVCVLRSKVSGPDDKTVGQLSGSSRPISGHWCTDHQAAPDRRPAPFPRLGICL